MPSKSPWIRLPSDTTVFDSHARTRPKTLSTSSIHLRQKCRGTFQYHFRVAPLRGSDPGASLYWLGYACLKPGKIRCMWQDGLYGLRQKTWYGRSASARPNRKRIQAAHMIGMPECNVILAQAVVYLARAPNPTPSTLPIVTWRVMCASSQTNQFRSTYAPTSLMKELGYSKGLYLILTRSVRASNIFARSTPAKKVLEINAKNCRQ